MDITVQDLQVFCALSFVGGIFASLWLTRFFEVVHTWRLFKEVLYHLLYMAVGLVEDVEFIREVKAKHLHEAGYDEEQIRAFQTVDDYNLTQWKENVIVKLLTRIPPRFRTMMPFRSYTEATRYLNKALKSEQDRSND
jgi:hypothetical protein